MANITKGLGGAASGAAAGAAVGSVVPGIGTAIGAIGGGILGFLGSGGLGNDPEVQAHQAALMQGATEQDLANANQNVNGSYAQQQAFINALAAQNGISNQSQVYNQLQNVANGKGPNPAQAALAQATGANVANQAALMAGQRGTGANAGLLARQAALQGAATQQQAAGQGATLQAQQSLGALNQLGGIAGQQVAQAQNAVKDQGAMALAQQQNALGSIGAYNNAAVGNQSSVNSATAPLALGNQQYGQNLVGGLLNGAGGVATAFGKTGGGGSTTTPGTIDTSKVNTIQPSTIDALGSGGAQMAAHGGVIGPQSNVGKHFHKMAAGGSVQTILSPGEKVLSPSEAEAVASKERAASKTGSTVPGKAKVKGDSKKNDVVPEKLEAGSVVIPRTKVNSKDSDEAAAKFVAAVLAKQGMKK